MAKFNFNLLSDELSLPAWLALAALAQGGVSFLAPAKYALVPSVLVLSVLTLNFVLQYTGLVRNVYYKDARMGRISVLFPEKDGSRPADLGDKPVTMFLLGLRSNTPLGRLQPAYKKLNDYLDQMYDDCEDNRANNGYLGRTPDLIAKEFSQNNTLLSISYWRSLEDLERWARRPVHLRGLRFLDFEVNKSGRPFDLGVVHEVIVSPAGHWEGIYSNMNPWGISGTKFPLPGGGLRDPYMESNPKLINGMWGRMGNRIKSAEHEKKTIELLQNLE
jgi:hypothetical protein